MADQIARADLQLRVSAMFDAYPLFDVPIAEWVEVCRELSDALTAAQQRIQEMTEASNQFARREISSGKLAEVLGCEDKHGFKNEAHAFCDAADYVCQLEQRIRELEQELKTTQELRRDDARAAQDAPRPPAENG